MTAERVEQVALPALVEQALLLVLAVDLDEGTGHVGEARRRHRLIVEARRRPAGRGHLAGRDQRLREPVEERRHARGIGAVADQRRVGAGSGRKAQRVDQEALAGSGLAGEDVQPGRELEPEPLDQRQIGDGQLEESAGASVVAHDGSSSTFRRNRSQNGCAPDGSMSRIGRSSARTSTTSPATIGTSSRPSMLTIASCASTTRQRTIWSRTDDDRPDRRQVAGDRGDDQVPAQRVDDRAAGAERVAGRARRARDHEAVGDERGEVRRPDRDVEPADPGERAAGDDDVVERVVRRRRRASPAGQDPGLERHPLVDRVLAGDEMGEHSLQLGRLRLRQESDLAEVDAEERHVDLDHGPGGAEERSVATEDDEDVGRRRGRAHSASKSPAWAAHWSMPRTAHQPAARSRSSTAASLVGL